MNADPLPRGLPLHFERIRGFLDLDMMEDAWRELDAVPLNARHDRSYRWLRIRACLGLDKHFEATKMTAEICSEYPEHEENWLFLANLLVKVGFLDLAIETLEGAQEQNDSPDIRYELAANLCASGKIELPDCEAFVYRPLQSARKSAFMTPCRLVLTGKNGYHAPLNRKPLCSTTLIPSV
jgi:predicted Zn-dependent protease